MRRIAIGLLLLLAWASSSTAQEEPTRESSQPDVRVTVRTKGGQTTFHLGEVIPLELSFTSTARSLPISRTSTG